MKFTKEIKFGFFIFLGIGFYFLLMELLGLTDIYILRLFNALIIIFGLNLTIKQNLKEGKTGYLENLFSTSLTGFIGIALGIVGLISFIKIKGGTTYLKTLSEAFMFGGNPSIAQYAFGLFIEGIGSVLIVSFITIQYWRTKDVFKDDKF